MAAHRYWRIKVTNGADYTTIHEMEFRDVLGGGHSAVSGVPSASSTFDAGSFAAPRAFDNITSTAWIALVPDTFPEWLAFTFDTAVDIVQYAIQSGSGTIFDWVIESSDDGAVWVSEDVQTGQDPSGSLQVYSLGTPIVPVLLDIAIKNIVTDKSVDLSIKIKNIVAEIADLSFGLKNTVADKPVNLSFGLKNTVYVPINLSFSIKNIVNNQVISDVILWDVAIILGGVDVSAMLTGEISFDREKGAAALADFELFPFAGVVDVYDWIDKRVTIDYISRDSLGVVISNNRIYTGVVNQPVFNPSSGTTKFTCTDNLQETFESANKTDIDKALIGSRWSKHIFRDPKDNWTYAIQRLKTIAASYQLDRYKVGQLTQWQAKAVSDYVFTEDDVFYQSIKTNLQIRRGLINKIKITLNNRYIQRWKRTVTGNWTNPKTFFAWLTDSDSLPDKGMIRSAVNSSGWSVDKIGFIDLPPTGFYGIINIVHWTLNTAARQLAFGFSFTAHKKWKQTLTDKYQIDVVCEAGIDQHGEIIDSSRYTIDGDAEDEWEDDEKDFVFNALVSINATDQVDHKRAEEEQVVDIDNALETAIAVAKTRLLAIYKNNSIDFEVPFNPAIDLSHTVEISTTATQAKGALNRIVGRLNIETGEAVSQLSIDITLPNIAGQNDDAIAAPSSPYVAPTNGYASIVPLGTHIGNVVNAPKERDDWRGYIGNNDYLGLLGQSAIDKGAPYYDERLVIEYPEVAASERDSVDHVGNYTYNVALPQDTLIVTGQ